MSPGERLKVRIFKRATSPRPSPPTSLAEREDNEGSGEIRLFDSFTPDRFPCIGFGPTHVGGYLFLEKILVLGAFGPIIRAERYGRQTGSVVEGGQRIGLPRVTGCHRIRHLR